MAARSTSTNGRGRLEDAMAVLLQNRATFVQNQAAFVPNQATFLARMSESERLAAERFARIEAEIGMIHRLLAEHSRALAKLSRLMERLPEAVREKIGSKTP